MRPEITMKIIYITKKMLSNSKYKKKLSQLKVNDLFLSLCETTYVNKLAFMYYYNFFKVVYKKNIC
jgi:hypothetical protein